MVVLEVVVNNMCVVSMVGDHYNDKWRDKNWNWPSTLTQNPISREEFDALRKEVLEMKQLLLRAVEYDKRNNEPSCEMEEKVALLKRVAELVGVDLEEIFSK